MNPEFDQLLFRGMVALVTIWCVAFFIGVIAENKAGRG